MDFKKIIEYLSDNSLSSVEIVDNKEEQVVVKFFYDFDEDELKASKAYANDECEDEKEGENWYDEFFLPYLSDIAVDSVGEVIEEIADKLNVDSQYISYDLEEEEYKANEFVAIFFKKGANVEIEDVLDELNI